MNEHPSATLVEVIVVETLEGCGTQESPLRVVTYYFAKDGRRLARYDPVRDAERLNAPPEHPPYQGGRE